MDIRVCLFAALLAGSVHAQTIATGEVTGTVTYSSGAVVTSAAIVPKSLDTRESRAARSNGADAYRFPLVKPGSYESAAADGLRSDRCRFAAAVRKVEPARQTVQIAWKLRRSKPAMPTSRTRFRRARRNCFPCPAAKGVAYSMPGVVINNRYGNGESGITSSKFE